MGPQPMKPDISILLKPDVRATKTMFDKDPSARPLVSDYRIMESDATDSLPDGNYELLVNRELITQLMNAVVERT